MKEFLKFLKANGITPEDFDKNMNKVDNSKLIELLKNDGDIEDIILELKNTKLYFPIVDEGVPNHYDFNTELEPEDYENLTLDICSKAFTTELPLFTNMKTAELYGVDCVCCSPVSNIVTLMAESEYNITWVVIDPGEKYSTRFISLGFMSVILDMDIGMDKNKLEEEMKGSKIKETLIESLNSHYKTLKIKDMDSDEYIEEIDFSFKNLE